MKILITTDWYEPQTNGVVVSVSNLKKGLESLGHEVRVATLSPNFFAHINGDVYYFPSLDASAVYSNARVILSRYKPIIEEIVRWGPDIIHSQCELSTFLVAKSVKKKTGAKIVHTYHTDYERYMGYLVPLRSRKITRKSIQKVLQSLSRDMDTIVAPTEKTREILESYRLRTPIHVVPTGLEPPMELKTTKESRIRDLHFSESDFVIGVISRLAEEKSVKTLLEYLSYVEDSSLKMAIVGDGPDRKKLEKLTKDLNLSDRVLFAGQQPHEFISEWFFAIDCFSSASTSETQGLTYYEALQHGKPLLVARDRSLQGVVIEGINGFTFENLSEFQAGLNSLKSEIKTYSIAAELSSRKFDHLTFAKRMEKIYRSLL